MHRLGVVLLLPLLAGCYTHDCTDPEVSVSPWTGTPGMGVQWDDLDGSFPNIEDVIGAAIEADGNATAVVPDHEYDDFERAMDEAWAETGRPGTRPNQGNLDIVEYQAREWSLYDERICS